MSAKLISVVAPCYNEAAGIEAFHDRVARVFEGAGRRAEFVYVNDGSRDDTLARLEALRARDPRVAVLNLSRNFGKEVAMTAGLDFARGDAVVVIDADLQDPPEVIPDLLAAWENGFDVVLAQRRERRGESWLKRATAHGFYSLMQTVGEVRLPRDTGDFRLMSRRAVDALSTLRERHRFMKGLFAWIGYPGTTVYYDRDPRFSGETSWNYWRLWNFALEGITSHTVSPLKVSTYLGLGVAGFSFFYGLFLVGRTLLLGNPVPGYPSLMAVILFLGGTQLTVLGVMGEYLGRVFNETKNRPLYLIERYLPGAAPEPAAEARQPSLLSSSRS